MTPDIVCMIDNRSAQGFAEHQVAGLIRRRVIEDKEVGDSLVDCVVSWQTQMGGREVSHCVAVNIVLDFVGCLASKATAPLTHGGTALHAAWGDPCVEQRAIEGREDAGCCYPCNHGHRCEDPLDSDTGEHV